MRTVAFTVGAVMLVATHAAALQVVTPLPQTVVRAGAVVTVTVAPSSGEQLVGASGATSEQTVEATAGTQPGTFDLQIPIPSRAVGPTFVFVAADLSTGGIATASVILTADPGPLSDLIVTAPPVLTAIGQIGQVTVKGVFADGVTRNMPLVEQGTTYRSTDANILAVDSSGRIQARARGRAQLVVTSTHVVSGAVTMAGVIVQCDVPSPPDNRIPIADAGADLTTAPLKVVHLDASASSDPDGDAITYSWTQESGRTVILRGADTATPFFLSPRVAAPDVLEFSVVITDSKGASTLPKIVRVTVQP